MNKHGNLLLYTKKIKGGSETEITAFIAAIKDNNLNKKQKKKMKFNVVLIL